MGGASAGAGGATPFAQAVENQSADCAVGTLPEASALTQIPKLPDPFLKLDGKRVSSVADQAHCSYKTEYTDLLAKSIAAFLKHTGDAPGQFLVGSGGSLTRSDWIDWQAPTLQ